MGANGPLGSLATLASCAPDGSSTALAARIIIHVSACLCVLDLSAVAVANLRTGRSREDVTDIEARCCLLVSLLAGLHPAATAPISESTLLAKSQGLGVLLATAIAACCLSWRLAAHANWEIAENVKIHTALALKAGKPTRPRARYIEAYWRGEAVKGTWFCLGALLLAGVTSLYALPTVVVLYYLERWRGLLSCEDTEPEIRGGPPTEKMLDSKNSDNISPVVSLESTGLMTPTKTSKKQRKKSGKLNTAAKLSVAHKQRDEEATDISKATEQSSLAARIIAFIQRDIDMMQPFCWLGSAGVLWCGIRPLLRKATQPDCIVGLELHVRALWRGFLGPCASVGATVWPPAEIQLFRLVANAPGSISAVVDEQMRPLTATDFFGVPTLARFIPLTAAIIGYGLVYYYWIEWGSSPLLSARLRRLCSAAWLSIVVPMLVLTTYYPGPSASGAKDPRSALSSCAGSTESAIWALQAASYVGLMLVVAPVGSIMLCSWSSTILYRQRIAVQSLRILCKNFIDSAVRWFADLVESDRKRNLPVQ